MQNNTFPTLFVGQNIEKLAEVDSTNNYLKLLLSNCEPPAHGTVIMAVKQYAGRGQHGNEWLSAAGKNLTISCYLKTDFIHALNQFNLNKVVSLAVYDCLNKFFNDKCYIKWPNDIYVGNKKICGILIENRIQGQYLKDSIIGIGINVNQVFFGDNHHITSLATELKRQFDLNELLKTLCICLEKRFLELKKGFSNEQHKMYLENLFRYRVTSAFNIQNTLINGKITGVDDAGRLKVEINGQEKLFEMKEISFIL